MDETALTASIVITTRNRMSELRRALQSCSTQTCDVEVVVIDDASEDGTDAMVQQEFPDVRFHRAERAQGYIIQRNLGASIATGDILFSIDDDAEFANPDVVRNTLEEFDSNHKIGAVAIPYIEPQKANSMLQKSPGSDGIWQTSNYIGTAHAVRRNVFLELGGYQESLIHQGEESDFCIRMLEAGYIVKLGNGSHIIHHESPKRDFSRMDYFGARNSILFLWWNVPMPYVLIHLPVTTIRCILWTLKPTRLKTRLKALADALLMLPQTHRRPVRVETYKHFMRMRKQGPVRVDL